MNVGTQKIKELISLLTHSHGSLELALNSINISRGLVGETIDLLNELAQEVRSLTIRWVRGHQRYIGNERADLMARRGRDRPGPQPQKPLGLPRQP